MPTLVTRYPGIHRSHFAFVETPSSAQTGEKSQSGETSDETPSTSDGTLGDSAAASADGGEKTDGDSSTDWERLKKLTDKEITRKDLQVAASVALASAAVKAKVRKKERIPCHIRNNLCWCRIWRLWRSGRSKVWWHCWWKHR